MTTTRRTALHRQLWSLALNVRIDGWAASAWLLLDAIASVIAQHGAERDGVE